MALAPRQAGLLRLLVERAGQVLSKDMLIEAAWPDDVAVTDNSLEQAMSGLRRTLTSGVAVAYIETLARRGYRFTAAVTREERRESDEELAALLAPHRAWIEGRAALETLEREPIGRARAVFEDVLAQVPHQASAHIGLANACAMQFEMTRADSAPDLASLDQALHHAREACRLDPQYGEAWATLGFVLERTGQHEDGLAASRRAVALEPDNWRHHLRLSYASWGEERLRGARRTLALLPGLPLAHWLAATVHVARQALGEAERELAAGIAVQTDVASASTRFSGLALHWLMGLIQLSRGAFAEARLAFDSELMQSGGEHLYARECGANTWYAAGALEWRLGRHEQAAAGFSEALRRQDGHPMAALGLAALTGVGRDAIGPRLAEPGTARRSPVERAMARAAWMVMTPPSQDHAQAAALVTQALVEAPAGSFGWLLPLEPILNVSAEPAVWTSALAMLRNRAA